MISSHSECLSGILKEDFHKFKFITYIPDNPVDHDTVVSDCKDKKIAIITRHHLDFTCSATHSLILDKEFYERL